MQFQWTKPAKYGNAGAGGRTISGACSAGYGQACGRSGMRIMQNCRKVMRTTAVFAQKNGAVFVHMSNRYAFCP